jgi:hypothetical protein
MDNLNSNTAPAPVIAEAEANPAPAPAPDQNPGQNPAPAPGQNPAAALAEACARARGESPIPGDEAPVGRITAARKEYSARGRCQEHWFRMRWSGNQWEYLGERIGGPGGFRASERRQASFADVWTGDLLAQHDRGGPINAVFIVVPKSIEADNLAVCKFVRTRDGNLRITLPDGSVITRPNPRR